MIGLEISEAAYEKLDKNDQRIVDRQARRVINMVKENRSDKGQKCGMKSAREIIAAIGVLLCELEDSEKEGLQDQTLTE